LAFYGYGAWNRTQAIASPGATPAYSGRPSGLSERDLELRWTCGGLERNGALGCQTYLTSCKPRYDAA